MGLYDWVVKKLGKSIHSYVFDVATACQDITVDVLKRTQELEGRVKDLEEQIETQHKFMVEINKYLVNFSDTKESIMAKEMKVKKEVKKPKAKHMDKAEDMKMLKSKVKKSCMK